MDGVLSSTQAWSVWPGVTWHGVTWHGVTLRGMVWHRVVQGGVVRRVACHGVVWCGVAWRAVERGGAVCGGARLEEHGCGHWHCAACNEHGTDLLALCFTKRVIPEHDET